MIGIAADIKATNKQSLYDSLNISETTYPETREKRIC